MEDRSGRVGGQESRARTVCWQEGLVGLANIRISGGPERHMPYEKIYNICMD